MSLFKDTYGRPRVGIIATVFVVAIVILIFIVGFVREFFQIVPPSYKGIVVKWGQLQQEVLSDGFYFKLPFWTDIVPVFTGQNSTDISPNKDNFIGIEPLSKDGQKMNVDIQIAYQVSDPYKFRKETWNVEPATIETLKIIPLVRSLIYDYTAEYTWKNLIQGAERQELGQRIERTLLTWEKSKRVCSIEKRETDEKSWVEKITLAECKIVASEKFESIQSLGVWINSVNLRKLAPNDAIINSIELAQKKEQDVKVAEQEAKIAEQNANKAIEEKRGQTESTKLEADASAYKLKVEKEQEALGIEAMAKAQKELNSALQGSKDLIEYKRLDIEMKQAEAQLEYAKHYTGQVPANIQVIGTDEAKSMNLILGNGIPVLNTEK